MRLYATLPVLFLVSSAVLPGQVLSAPTQESQALARADLSERAAFGTLVSSLLKYLNLGSLMGALSHVVPGARRDEFSAEELVATLNQLNLRDSEVTPPSISGRDDISERAAFGTLLSSLLSRLNLGSLMNALSHVIPRGDEFSVEELVATLNQLKLRDSEVTPPSISGRDDISVEDLVTVLNRLNQRDSEVAPVDFGKVLKLFGRMLDELD